MLERISNCLTDTLFAPEPERYPYREWALAQRMGPESPTTLRPGPATVERLAAALVDGLRNMDPKPLGPFNGHERHD